MVDRKRKQKECCEEWCCPGRCAWFQELAVGIVVVLAVFAIVFASWAWARTQFDTGVVFYSTNGPLHPSPASHNLQSSTLTLAMTLPHNLVEYVGGTYNVDCFQAGHTVQILPGTLGTTWDGIASTLATCTTSTGGFTFHVMSSNRVRIISQRNVIFS